MEGCPGPDLATLTGFAAAIPDGPPETSRLARSVVLTDASLVSSLGGRADPETNPREAALSNRLFRPDHLLPLVEESLCHLAED